jgi:hypothetical protein
LRERARADLAEAEGALALAERLAAVTLACASESVQAARLAVRAASKVPAARFRVTTAHRDLASAEHEAARLDREERVQRERDSATALSDEERHMLQLIAPERERGKGLIAIPGVAIETLQDAQRQAAVDRGAFLERPATGARAHALRALISLFASMHKPTDNARHETPSRVSP